MADRSGRMRGRRAFTLVELLVVVSIIGILLSVLLPSLRDFREHARTVACQSHIGTVGKGLINYALELDTFPITSDGNGKAVSWRYGGWTGSNRQIWKVHEGGTYYIPTQARPLSAYMFRAGQLTDNTRLPVFRCPSDTLSRRVGTKGLALAEIPTYEDIGTSYHLNWHWFGIQTVLPGAPDEQNRDINQVPRGERIWWKYMQRNVSRFVTLTEDPAEFGLGNREQIEGNHRKFSKHNFAFLDGHAEYLYADTRSLHQREWTVVDETPPYKEWRTE